jgi:hypothetical protein
MYIQYMRRGRALVTAILMTGGCSFLAAQTTTAILLNQSLTGWNMEPVKGATQSACSVSAEIQDFEEGMWQYLPGIQFRDPSRIENITFDRARMVILRTGDTQGGTMKVSFKLTEQAPAFFGLEQTTGFLEYSACLPADTQQAPSCALAIPGGSSLAKGFQLVPVDRKDLPDWMFGGKPVSVWSLRPRSEGPSTLVTENPDLDIWADLGPGSDDDKAYSPPASPLGAGRKPEPVSATAKPGQAAPAGVPKSYPWEVIALAAPDFAVMQRSLQFKPGEVAVGEVFTGECVAEAENMNSGNALIGIRFDCADGKSSFGGRMAADIPTETRSASPVKLGVLAKAPEGVVRVTFSVQLRGCNSGAKALFNGITFKRLGVPSAKPIKQ